MEERREHGDMIVFFKIMAKITVIVVFTQALKFNLGHTLM